MEQRHLCHPCYLLWKLFVKECCMNSRSSSQVWQSIFFGQQFWSRHQSLRHLKQNEIQAAKNKPIKEVIGVPSKEIECAAKVITINEKDDGNKRKSVKGFDIFDDPQKTTSSSGATADNSHAEVAKKLLCQMSATWEVENYLNFFAIKVTPDVIPIDWWKVHRNQFHALPNSRENGCVWLLHQLLPKVCFWIVGYH